MQTVYFISGLGADKRAFQFLDLSFCDPVFVEWIRPLPAEKMAGYASRLKDQIHDKEPVIVGLSFGGMIAIEMAKQFPVKKLVLLSSAKTEKEIPSYLRFLRYFPLHRILPASFLRWGNQFAYRLMGTTNRKDKIVFRQMLNDADDTFILWAIDQIVHWKNSHILPNTFHIHGTADILLPYRYIRADHTVEGGEHLMLMQQAAIISAQLRQIIAGDWGSGSSEKSQDQNPA